MKVLFPKCLFVALGAAMLPALAVAQSYLPLPETSAPVYRPVSSQYASQATGSSLINAVATPPVAEASPSDHDSIPSPAASYGQSVSKGKSCGKAGSYGKTGYGGCGSDGCLSGLLGGRGCWYGSTGVIWFDRDNDDNVYLSVFDNAIDVGVLDSHDAKMDRTAGGEFTVGRYLNCGQSAIEFTYWGLDPNQQTASVFDPNPLAAAPNLISALDFTPLNYDDGVNPAGSIDNWFNGARVHLVSRNYRYDNLELNLVHHSCSGCVSGLCGCERRYNVSMFGGLRYLDMNEDLIFDADDTDTTFDGGIGEVKYCVDLQNQLLGFQLGCRGDYCLTHSLALHHTCKVGLYGNRINQYTFVGGINGAATVGAGPNAGRAYDIRSNKTDFAMMAELDLGMSYQLSCRWRATAGYRLIALSGVALPGQQIPRDFADIDGAANIAAESSLILNGGYAGLEFNF